MDKRPKRPIKPPLNLKEYVIATETDGEDERELLKQKADKLPTNKSCNSVLKCMKCNTFCKSQSQLLTHIKKHKGKENFLCEECGKSLSSYQAFSEHMNIHENFKPHKCEVCGHESRQLSVHSRHMLTHEKSLTRTFKCSICSRTFKQKEYLKQHTRKHLGEKPYKCEQCCKSFTAKTELNRHQACHSSVRPFSCEHCNKKFKLKHNLNAHIKAHTGIQLWKCCLCKASFPQQCLIEKHKRLHTEMIQHLELVKTGQRTLTITSFPLDRRKVAHQQKVTLPSKLDLNDPKNVFNTKVSLAFNDAFIPISVIVNSFGTGNYIKMKIVDQINLGTKICAKTLPATNGVANVVIVDEVSVLECDFEPQTQISATMDSEGKPCNEDQEEADDNEETAPPVTTQFDSHFDCFEKAFSVDCLDDSKIAWLRSLTGIVREMTFPLHHLVCHRLHSVIMKLQNILILNSTQNIERTGATLNLHAPSCEFCTLAPSSNDVTEYGTDKNDVEGSSDAEFQSFDDEVPIDEESKNSKKLKFRVMLCNSANKENERAKRRLKELYKSYLMLLKILQKHFRIVFE